MDSFTIETVQNVIQTFYYPKQVYPDRDTNEVMSQAQEWLLIFQKSPAAWVIAQKLLECTGVEFQYFGASSIEGKLKSEWQTMSNELRSSILAHLLHILQTSTILHRTVVTRLCLSVAVIACHSVPNIWINPIPDILSLANPNNNGGFHIRSEGGGDDLDGDGESLSPKTITIDYLTIDNPRVNLVLELLSILPDELLTCDYIAQEKRTRVGNEINRYTKTVIDMLTNIMGLRRHPSKAHLPIDTATATTIMKGALKCLKNWILFDIQPALFLLGPIITQHCFDAVAKDAHLVEEFVGVLDETMTFMRGKIFRQYPTTFNTVVGRMLETLPRYAMLAQLEDNERIFNAIFQLFLHVPETQTRLLLASPHSDQFMNSIIEMASKADMDSCELLGPVVIEIVSLSEQDNVDVTPWHRFLDDLIDVYRNKCMYPLDEDNVIDSGSEYEKFTSLRTNAGDSLLSIHCVLEERTKNHLLGLLWNDISQYNNNHMAANGWRAIESTIFLLGCLSEGITDDTSFIPQLFQLLGALPVQSTPLVKSTIILAGKYSNLLEKSSSFLLKIVSDFIPAFTNPDLSSSAAESFLSITKNKNCSKLLSPNLSSLISLCTPILSSNIETETKEQILDGLFEVISVVRTQEMLSHVSPLISPHIETINQLSTGPISHPTHFKRLLSSISVLTRLIKIFGSDDNEQEEQPDNNNNNGNGHQNNGSQQQQQQSQTILPIIEILLPMTTKILEFNDREDIIESISQLYKRIALTCNKSGDALMPLIFPQMTNAFLKQPTSQSLNTLCIGLGSLQPTIQYQYVGQSITNISNAIINMWKRFISPRIPNMTYNLSIQPDLTKEYFSLVGQCLSYNVLSTPPGLLTHLFQIVLENLLFITDKNTARPSFSFIANLISISHQQQDSSNYHNIKIELDKLLQQHGEYLIKQLLVAVGGGIPRSVTPHVAEVLYSLISYYPNTFRPIALVFLQTNGFPSTHITQEQKLKFLANIMRFKSKSQFRKSVSEFSMICLGITDKGLS